MFTEAQAKEIFESNSLYITGKNVIPYENALQFVTMDAIDFALRQGSSKNHWINTENGNGYGIGDYTVMYLTEKGWTLAVTYMNISSYRDHIKKDNVKEWTEYRTEE